MDFSKLSIDEARKIAGSADMAEKRKLIDILKSDNRKGIINIAKGLEREIQAYNNEMDRLMSLKKYEYTYINKGAKYIAGIDEVGRGPLAGPVYACAVVMPIDCMIEGINDSKKLSPQRREELSIKIKEKAISYSIGWCDEKAIDEVNILNATFMAMRQAIEGLEVKPQVLLIDAVRIPGVDIFQVPIVKGDSLSFSIASASIVAKVERDRVMEEYHERYPAYNFAANKGYGSGEHIDAIKKYGPCPIHRRSFIGGILQQD